MKRNNIFLLYALIAIIILSCDKGETMTDMSNVGNTGVGGSMARFAITGDYLYTVDSQNLNVYDISTPSNPIQGSSVNVGFDIETIYPYNQNLFLGSQWGMYIYGIANPSNPVFISEYSHIYSCDPVVVDDNYAYVTLSSESNCGRSTNQLEIIDISNLNSPETVKTYEMTKPKGLGISGTTLFICDNGLKVYDASNVNNLLLKATFNIPAYDVIAIGSNLIVTGDAGIYQYSFANDTITYLSLIQAH